MSEQAPPDLDLSLIISVLPLTELTTSFTTQHIPLQQNSMRAMAGVERKAAHSHTFIRTVQRLGSRIDSIGTSDNDVQTIVSDTVQALKKGNRIDKKKRDDLRFMLRANSIQFLEENTAFSDLRSVLQGWIRSEMEQKEREWARELLQAMASKKPPGRPKENYGGAPTISRTQVAEDAGLSRDQKVTCLRVTAIYV